MHQVCLLSLIAADCSLFSSYSRCARSSERQRDGRREREWVSEWEQDRERISAVTKAYQCQEYCDYVQVWKDLLSILLTCFSAYSVLHPLRLPPPNPALVPECSGVCAYVCLHDINSCNYYICNNCKFKKAGFSARVRSLIKPRLLREWHPRPHLMGAALQMHRR